MSDRSKSDLALGETEKKMYLSTEDVKNVRDFYTHFEIPITDSLKLAMEAFEKDQSYENQENFKLETCKDLANSQHEIFVDEMFTNIRKDTQDIAYEMSFNKDLEDTLRNQQTGENTGSSDSGSASEPA